MANPGAIYMLVAIDSFDKNDAIHITQTTIHMDVAAYRTFVLDNSKSS